MVDNLQDAETSFILMSNMIAPLISSPTSAGPTESSQDHITNSTVKSIFSQIFFSNQYVVQLTWTLLSLILFNK